MCILPHNQWLMYNLKIFALSLWKWFFAHLWPSLEAGHNREHCTLRAIRDRLSFSSPSPPPAKLLDTVLCCNVSQEHTRTSSWPAQSNAVASLTGNVHHLLCHAWGPVANTDGRILWPSPLSTRPLHKRAWQRWFWRCRGASLYAHWILLLFLKQCARKHKWQETFTAAHASWRRHPASDPRTVKNHSWDL